MIEYFHIRKLENVWRISFVRVSCKHKSLKSFVLFNFIYTNAFLQLNLCVAPMRASLQVNADG